MAHFAKLDENNIVTEVIVVSNDIATSESAGVTFINNLYGTSDTWKQTSYNTYGNVHSLVELLFVKTMQGLVIPMMHLMMLLLLLNLIIVGH